MRSCLILWLLVWPAVTFAQVTEEFEEEHDQPPKSRMQILQEKAMQLIGATRELGDWDVHYEYILDSVERVYERNSWDAESDLFALELTREVGAIPPWQPQQRMDMAMEMIGDRYLLDDDQLETLQREFIRTNIGLFTRHSDRIMTYATEAIQTRVAGEPFTPEQVARWVELAEPVFQDARRSVQSTVDRVAEELDPEQRELMMRDMAAANRRMNDIERMSEKWKRGEWDPHDWGMEEDPIQMQGMSPEQVEEYKSGGLAARKEPRPNDGQPPEVGVSEAQPDQKIDPKITQADDEWARYVRAFIKKYGLNHEQQQRAWLFYNDAKQRDGVFEKRFTRQTTDLRSKMAESESERLKANLRKCTEKRELERERMFNLLKRRLERLPTRGQRKSVSPAKPKNVAKPEQTTAPTNP